MSMIQKRMRDALLEQIYVKMGEHEDIFFLTADLGAPILDDLKEKYKDRFINVGIAEQDLINISTGLALEGFVVYAYVIAPFMIRAYEQIRINLSLLGQTKPLNVNLIGIGTGISYDVSGPTHHCMEDVSVMRVLPNMMIYSPSDWFVASELVEITRKIQQPKYIRLDGKPLPRLYQHLNDGDIERGFLHLAKGKDVCLVTTGFTTHVALEVAEKLKAENFSVGIVDVFRLKPLKEEDMKNILNGYDMIVTLEEGFINCGGLDSMVLGFIQKMEAKKQFLNFGIKDQHLFSGGGREFLYQMNGLDAKTVCQTIKSQLSSTLSIAISGG